MTLIITKDGKSSQKLERTPFGLEDNLQDYIHKNPEAIPLYEIKEDIRLLVLVREFPTESGPIDALGIDRDGELYLIETKLYKNQDKRQVVAQVMDYGASLWSNYHSFDEFLLEVNKGLEKQDQGNIQSRVAEFFGLEDAEVDELLDSMRINLQSGKFKFVILMDSLHQALKDLIVFLNQNSEFDIYAVELEYYKHEEFDITIPKLYGAQVKKDVSRTTYSKKILSDEEFVSSYQKSGYGEEMEKLIEFFNKVKNDSPFENVSASKTPKYLNFYIKGKDCKFTISIHQDPSYRDGNDINFWYDSKYWSKENRNKLKPVLERTLKKVEVTEASDTNYGKFAKWSFDNFSIDKFKEIIEYLSKY